MIAANLVKFEVSEWCDEQISLIYFSVTCRFLQEMCPYLFGLAREAMQFWFQE